jgi:4-amino-4-deoxy-L-arabinose transferase-like glycosyltransferase
LFALLLRWPSSEQPIDNDGGARAYHARLILAGEPLYSTHHTGHHLPGIYYTYAAAFTLFGDSPEAIKFLLLLWTIPTVYMLYRLGWLLMSPGAALLAAVFYAILSAQVQMWGLTAETELFANLFRITAVYLLLYLLQKNAANWKFVWVGLCAAAAFLYKAIYLSPLALAGLVLLIEFWRNRQTAGAFRQMVVRGLWLGVGFVAGLLPVALYFAAQGLWPRLLLVFTLAQSYGAASEVIPGALPFWAEWLLYPLLPLYGLAFNNAVLLFCSLAAFVVILLNRTYRQTMLLYLAIWYALSFVEAGVKLELFAHYYLLIVPPMALLAAWFLVKVYEDVKEGSYGRLAPFLLAGLLLFILVWSGRRNFPYYYHFLQYKLGQETLAESVEKGWPGFGERLARARELADYVKVNTAEEDQIYVWSEDVQLYYLAGRRSPIDLLWPIDVAATGPPERIFTPATKLIVVDLRREPGAPPWLQAGLAESYELETTFDEQEIYRRVD